MTAFRRPLVVALFVLVVALGIDFGADRSRRVIDLTADRSLSLTEQTERIAGAVRTTTTVTVFLRPDDPERAPAAALLLRYQRLNRRIGFRILDPETSLGEQRRLGIDSGLGGIAVAQGEVVEVVPTVTEQDVTGALARLARGRSAQLCFVTGHGEASLSDDGPEGLARAGALLEENGYVVRSVDLLSTPTIPDDCEAVVLANPLSPLDGAAAELERWLADEGRLLVLSDPASDVDVSPIVDDYGLGVRRGIVLEGDPASARPDDPTAPIVRVYSSSHPVVRRLAPTFFPGLQQVTVGESDPDAGLVVSHLADTSPVSYLETEPLTSVFDPATDAPGPITVAAASERSRVDGDQLRRSRVLVVGDIDFATNSAIGQAANSTFVVRSVDWLALDDQLLVLSANLPRSRALDLTKARITYARFVSLVLLPALFLLAGAAVWVVRRSR